jgi:hypothetical protein
MSTNDFTYPNSDLDRGKTLLSLLGTFWSRIYNAKDQMRSYVDATALTLAQTHKNTLALAASMSRYEIPLFADQTIVPIVIRRSELNSAVTNTATFDLLDEKFAGDLLFNVPVNDSFYAFPLPTNMVSVRQIFNRLTFPSVVLLNNVDYIIDTQRNALIFNENPFENPAVLKRAIGADDEEIVLWGFCASFDYQRVFNQFAYALGVQLKTSEAYKNFVNALFDGLLDGGITAHDLDVAISAMCGLPLAIENEEVVEVIAEDDHGLFIATDKHVYRFSASAVPVVTVGQVVHAGDQLVYGFSISEFFVGNTFIKNDRDDVVCCPAQNTFLATHLFEEITTENDELLLLNRDGLKCEIRRPELAALALDAGFLSSCFYGDLVFENKEVPLFVDTDHKSGYTYVEFEVGGYPADVKKFFDEVHQRGVAEAKKPANQCEPEKRRGTLAHYLDRRARVVTEPTAATLPQTINPLRFIVENVLRNNVFVIRINTAALGQNRLGLYNVRHLRQLLPPQTAAIVMFDLEPNFDKIQATKVIKEATAYFIGAEPLADNCGELVNDMGVTVRVLSGTCQ